MGRIGLPAWAQRKPRRNPTTNCVGASFNMASPQPDGRGSKVKRLLLAPALVTSLALTSAATLPARAGGGDLGAGLVAGVVTGTIIGAAVTAPRYYPPPPAYVAPAPYSGGELVNHRTC